MNNLISLQKFKRGIVTMPPRTANSLVNKTLVNLLVIPNTHVVTICHLTEFALFGVFHVFIPAVSR